MTTYCASPKSLRELHLVDIENLVGTPRFSTDWVSLIRTTYDRVCGSSDAAQYYVGTSTTHNVLNAALGWGAGRPVFSCGQNGAELAMLDAVSAFAGRFERVVIGSGDGIFAEFAAALQSGGSHVTVVSRRTALSRRLAFAVCDVRYLPEIHMQPGCRTTSGRAA